MASNLKSRMGIYGMALILATGTGYFVWGRLQSSAAPVVKEEIATRPDTPAAAPVLPTKAAQTAEPAIPGEPAEETQQDWIKHTIRKGETLAGIFNKYDLKSQTLHKLLQGDKHLQRELTRLYPGKTVKILLNNQGDLEKLVYERSRTEAITASRAEVGFDIEKIFKEPQRELRQASGTLESSLYLAAKKAGLSDTLTMQLTDIFAWDIDFSRSIRPGDSFNILYEELFIDGASIGNGPIVAAEFINQGKIHRALRFVHPDGSSDYYTPEGRTLRKAFLRMPVKSARITSRFNLHRRHPLLHRIRAHKGVDYAAPIGTPVRATGDGKIIFRGRKGGYGRVVIIQHGHRYSTLYAHLHRFNSRFRLGSKVKQGDIIAYVGKSGLATGPHLHYEFRIDGIHRDPLTVPLPDSKPIPKSLLATFKQQSTPLLAELERTRRTAMAQADDQGE